MIVWDIPKIKKAAKIAFSDKAWAYAVMYHSVAIGIWDNDRDELIFHTDVKFNLDFVTELRIFNSKQELRFVRNEDGVLLFRDSTEIKYYTTRDTAYLMHGTNCNHPDENNGLQWTPLSEDRGGKLLFPKKLICENKKTVMWLGIRNYLHFTDDLHLEVSDFTFTGFIQGKNKEKGVCLHVE